MRSRICTKLLKLLGAGEGNGTLVFSLEVRHFREVLQRLFRQIAAKHPHRFQKTILRCRNVFEAVAAGAGVLSIAMASITSPRHAIDIGDAACAGHSPGGVLDQSDHNARGLEHARVSSVDHWSPPFEGPDRADTSFH